MTDLRVQYLTAGALIRLSVRATLQRAGATFVEEKHFLDSTFWDIRVPERNAAAFKRWYASVSETE